MSVNYQETPPNNLTNQEIRDTFSQGLLALLQPSIDQIDGNIQEVRVSQVKLREQIDLLVQDLQRISEERGTPLDLDPYVKKLNNAKRRVMLVNNILQNAQERIGKLYHAANREQHRHQLETESNSDKSENNPSAAIPPQSSSSSS